jgi:hypothetical protein
MSSTARRLRPLSISVNSAAGLAAAGDVAGDGLALRVEAKAACALPVGGNPVIRHEIRHAPWGVFSANVGLD